MRAEPITSTAMSSVRRLWRYYQAGIVNTLFGYGMFALFVKLGLYIYVAQICAHVLGVTFNYFSYSRHVFNDSEACKRRFILSYVFNYLLGLASLTAALQFVSSPYIAGIFSILVSSIVNFFVLKHLVFVRQIT